MQVRDVASTNSTKGAVNPGMMCHVGFGVKDPNPGDYYCFLETLACGYGGRVNSDGPDAVDTHIQNTQNAPVEETELNYPVRVPRYSLVPDSDGPGRQRGGLGLCREYVFVDHQPVVTLLADRAKFPPLGLFGGEAGKVGRYSLITEGSRAGDTLQREPASEPRRGATGWNLWWRRLWLGLAAGR